MESDREKGQNKFGYRYRFVKKQVQIHISLSNLLQIRIIQITIFILSPKLSSQPNSLPSQLAKRRCRSAKGPSAVRPAESSGFGNLGLRIQQATIQMYKPQMQVHASVRFIFFLFSTPSPSSTAANLVQCMAATSASSNDTRRNFSKTLRRKITVYCRGEPASNFYRCLVGLLRIAITRKSRS